MSQKDTQKQAKATEAPKSAVQAVEDAKAKVIEAVKDLRNKHPYRIKNGNKVSTKAVKSRRQYIAELAHEGKHTKAEINAKLISTFDIADKPNNLKAISGTLYDLQTNGKCDFKIDEETGIVTCKSTTCKYYTS